MIENPFKSKKRYKWATDGKDFFRFDSLKLISQTGNCEPINKREMENRLRARDKTPNGLKGQFWALEKINEDIFKIVIGQKGQKLERYYK